MMSGEMEVPGHKLGEAEARQILESILGVPIDRIDGNVAGSGLHDLEVRWPNHRPWVVEVKTETDALSLGLLSALTKHGYALDTDALASRWHLGLLPRASIKTVRDELPGYLAAVEAEGWSEFIRMFADYSPAVREVVERFHVWHGKDVGTTEQPRLVLLPPTPIGAWGHRLELVNETIERWANRRDVRKKLNAPDASEGHLFVWVEEDAADLAWTLWGADFPPYDPPNLPPEVTGAWIATGDVQDPVVWFVRPPDDWQILGGQSQSWPGERRPEPPQPR